MSALICTFIFFTEYTEMAMNLLDRFEKCMDRYVGSGFSSEEEIGIEFPSEEQHRKKHRHRRHHRRHSHHSHHSHQSSQSDSSRDNSKSRSKERKKEPDNRKQTYDDDEDDSTSQITRNYSDWDQSHDYRSKSNHKKSQIFARISDQDKHRKLISEDERIDSLNDSGREVDQDWKDEDLSDHR